MTKHLFAASACIGWMLLCSGCAKKDDDKSIGTVSRGEALFASQRCANCHGLEGEGTGNAPPLTEARRHFSESQLVEYLRDPSLYIKNDPRLLKQQSAFASLMPSFKHLDDADLTEVARYVLSL